jgi:putative addiction module component (TIGR02574 family)
VTQTVLDAVLALPSKERAELAERLWASLPEENLDAEFAEELTQEIASRRERHLRGESQLHDWSNVRDELNAIINRADRA